MNKKNILFIAQNFKNELAEILGDLDYSLKSLSKVEDYIVKTIANPGKPTKKSIFATDTDNKAFGLGCYAGEVIRRSLPGVIWQLDEETGSPLNICLVNGSGACGLVINKAYKRVFEGEGDNILHFASIMIMDLLKDDSTTDIHMDDDDKTIVKYCDSLLCITSDKIYRGDLSIDDANYSNNTWIFTNADEVLDLNNENDFNYIFLNEIKERFPDLYQELAKKGDEPRVRIVKENSGGYRFEKAPDDLLWNSSAMASFQGNLRLNPFQWIKMNTFKVFRITLYLILSLYAMLMLHWVFTFVFVGCLLYNIWYWFSTKGRFSGGDVNPGKVLSINPDIIAVATDFTKMIGKYPVIKILETNLLSEDKVVGKIIPTIAGYHDNPHNYPFWSEFHPVPVSHGINDKDKLAYFMSKFSNEDLTKIDTYLEEINTQNIGTYKIQESTSGWKEYSHVDINKGINMEGPLVVSQDES